MTAREVAGLRSYSRDNGMVETGAAGGARSQGRSFLLGPAMREAEKVTGRLCHRSCTLRGTTFGPDAADLRRILQCRSEDAIANPPARHSLPMYAQEQMRAVV